MPSRSVLNTRILPSGEGENELTKQFPKLSGFLQGLVGIAPDEVGSGSVLDDKAMSSKKLQALGAKYGFPIGTLAQMLPFGGGIAKAPAVGAHAAQKGVVKLPGGNWRTGSIAEVLKPLKGTTFEGADLADPALWREAEIARENGPLNSWIDKKLHDYVKNDMGTEGDPIRALAERGSIHFQPIPAAKPTKTREAAGFQKDDYATSDLARQWERTADFSIMSRKAGDILRGPSNLTSKRAQPYIDKALQEYPWLAKVPPETPLHQPYSTQASRIWGFDHLIDELRNTLNPASGLPQELLWKYADLSKVSVPQAVERVAKINAWREAQAANADLQRANNAAVRTFKEYKENNPRGFRWAEVGLPEGLPEGFTLKPTKLTMQASAKAPVIEKDGFRVFAPDGRAISAAYGATEADALNAYNSTAFGSVFDARVKAFQDAIKFEGEAMGHSAAGYADVSDYGLGGLNAIKDGRAKIFTLRDGKHQPHVTIEVGRPPGNDPERYIDKAREQLIDELTPDDVDMDMDAFDELIYRRAQDLAADGPGPEPGSLHIYQIKGKGNRMPSNEYLPYVQDFVKSGKWSGVDELENAGLYEHPSTPGKYLTEDEFNAWKAGGKDENGYADGGLVQHTYNPDVVDAHVARLLAEMEN